jgi:hypothetical protein
MNILPPFVSFLLLVAGAGFAADSALRVEVIGGTVAEMPPKSKLRIDITGPESLHLKADKFDLQVLYSKINTLEYGQNVSRRYAAAIIISPVLLLSKSRRHYLTLGYADAEGRQQALVLRVDKQDIRALLVGLEARTGRRVEYQDQEARKAGKG